MTELFILIATMCGAPTTSACRKEMIACVRREHILDDKSYGIYNQQNIPKCFEEVSGIKVKK